MCTPLRSGSSFEDRRRYGMSALAYCGQTPAGSFAPQAAIPATSGLIQQRNVCFGWRADIGGDARAHFNKLVAADGEAPLLLDRMLTMSLICGLATSASNHGLSRFSQRERFTKTDGEEPAVVVVFDFHKGSQV